MKKTISEYTKAPKTGRRLFSLHRRDFLKYLGGGIIIIFNPLQGCKPKLAPVAAGKVTSKGL